MEQKNTSGSPALNWMYQNKCCYDYNQNNILIIFFIGIKPNFIIFNKNLEYSTEWFEMK